MKNKRDWVYAIPLLILPHQHFQICRIEIGKTIGLGCNTGEGICPQESRPHPGSKYYERWDIGEKHLPAVTVEDGAVHVNLGSINHPMIPEHYIEWIYVQTENSGHLKIRKPGDDPSAAVCLGDDKPLAVYAYCNPHGLWMTEL